MGKRSRKTRPDFVKGDDLTVDDVAIRMADKRDVPFIFKRTLREMRNWPLVHGMKDGMFHQYTHRALESMLLRCVTLVAYPSPKMITMNGSNMVRSGSPKRILGFLMCDPTEIGLVVHMLYVRRTFDDDGVMIDDYREKGVGKRLIEAAIEQFKLPDRKVFYTVKTAHFRYYPELRKRVEGDERLIYHPYLFFTLLEPGWEAGIRKPSSYSHLAAGIPDEIGPGA